jgi:hypothetical protein
MILPDVNVLVYAYREEAPLHGQTRAWLQHQVQLPQPFGLSEFVGSAFLRVVTHPRIFTIPSPLDAAFAFWNALATRENCVIIRPGPRHWQIFHDLCRAGGARGNLIPDAYLAALAIESGGEWITHDRGFSRFPGLRWSLPSPPPVKR